MSLLYFKGSSNNKYISEPNPKSQSSSGLLSMPMFLLPKYINAKDLKKKTIKMKKSQTKTKKFHPWIFLKL